ncbi:acetyl-CoA carboxylase biotin carboxyl carrier protein [Gottschalkiaceae bacterium SANA]|nr:acetyl-CoA carboxylase biotin carboxyl carrier protein [Gottschalkiaceae bacterium SANA]
MMKIEEIQNLLQTIDSLSLIRVEIETDGLRLITDKSKGPVQVQSTSVPVAVESPQVNRKREETVEPFMEETIELEGSTITSPIIGSFYAAPGPDADNYVEVGTIVKKDQTVCIVEAMKLMNEVTAEEDCEILECLIEDGQPVEYGQPLFRVKKV